MFVDLGLKYKNLNWKKELQLKMIFFNSQANVWKEKGT